MTLIYPGGGNCDPNEEPCVGPDCIDIPVGDRDRPDGDDGCLINCGGPTTCTGPCCVDNQCICDDCSYGEDGDWHVYWMCDVNNVPVNLGEVIVLEPGSSYNGTMEVLQSQNKHFSDSDLGFEQFGLDKIQIGDTFQKFDDNDYIIVGEDGPAFITIFPCFTYLGKKFADSPSQAVANGATYTEIPWADGSTYNYSKNGEPCDCTTAPPPPLPETGCQDPAACNYNSEATIHDKNLCCYDGGCTDETAVNYNPEICCDDGSCCYIPGCTDPNAVNYNIDACFDDGSCCLMAGCTDSSAFNYNALACEDDGGCCYTAGCTDATATNYDPLACHDDGSCEYCTSIETNSCETNGATNMNEFLNGTEVFNLDHLEWFINPTNSTIPFGNKYFEFDGICHDLVGSSSNGNSEYGGDGGGGGSQTGNPCPGPNGGTYLSIVSYTIAASDIINTVYSWQEALTFWSDNGAGQNINENMTFASITAVLNEVFNNDWGIQADEPECCDCTGGSTCGCTDSTATNYNPMATFDDGSCTYCTSSGCTNEECPDYSATYTCDCNGDPIGTFAEGWDSCCKCEGVADDPEPVDCGLVRVMQSSSFTAEQQLFIEGYAQGHAAANVNNALNTKIDLLTLKTTSQISNVSLTYDQAGFYNQVESGYGGAMQWSTGLGSSTVAMTFVSETLNPAASSNSGFDEWTYVYSFDHNITSGGATGFAVGSPQIAFGIYFANSCYVGSSANVTGIVAT